MERRPPGDPVVQGACKPPRVRRLHVELHGGRVWDTATLLRRRSLASSTQALLLASTRALDVVSSKIGSARSMLSSGPRSDPKRPRLRRVVRSRLSSNMERERR